ncbi:hypothetical protein J437_LFUL008816 [Ladona fulva]|uniref:TBC1 domain family member 15 n=1 Tax=Ladona fulva TaxID=123851 RepID=A0A8K0KHE7_LADFU|nr:hypothetical protein J437_LFUL008816 [Ladona fulva]
MLLTVQVLVYQYLTMCLLMYLVVHHGVQALGGESSLEDVTKHLIQLRMSTLDAAAKEEEYEIILPSSSPKLPPRPTVKRGPPVSLEEWAKHFDDDGRMINIKELKEKIFRGGISPILRYDAWKFLLDYMPSTATREEWQEIRKRKVEEYIQMKHQWKSMTEDQESRFSYFRERKNLIEKDVNRTDRTIPYFEGNDNPNVQLLYDILMTYVMYNFDLGYVQGMSDLLSPILYLMENEVDAFWCFVGFMNKMSKNFEMDQAGIKQQLKNLNILIRFTDRELGNYLESNESDNLFFCFRWLLILFKREFSYQDIMVLWEVLWSDLPGPNFHLFICLAILDTERDVLIGNEYGFTEILKHINDLSLHINLQDILIKAEAIYLQLLAAEELPDSVKVILNLPVSERRIDSESTEELVIPPTSDHISNGEPSQSESMESTEQMYEQALSLYL